MKDIFHAIFGLLSLAVLLLFITLVWRAYHPHYLTYQKEFRAMLVQKAASGTAPVQFKFGVRQRWIRPLNRTDRCETCHLGVDDPRFKDAKQPFATHPDFKTHDFQKFGCTVCHAGQGRAVTEAAAHGPVDNWNDAVYHTDFMENSCARCHGTHSTNQMPVYAGGRSLFKKEGCRGCHKLEGQERTQIEPPLTDMGARVKADWLLRWVRSPRSYLPHARMPNYRFADTQAADIARFLMKYGRPKKIELNGSYDNGKKIFNESRCVSCHSVNGTGGDIGPDLGRLATKLQPERLLQTITQPHELWPQTQMPIYGFSASEALDVATFMEQEYVDFDLTDQMIKQQESLVEKADAAAGRKLVREYGCIGCHGNVSDEKSEGEIGPELTDIGAASISHFEFGDINVDQKDRTVPNWIYNKVLNPRLYRANLKMPYFYFNPQAAVEVTTYLLSLKGDAPVPRAYMHPFEHKQTNYSPQGPFGRIIDKYRCLTCHKIYGNGGTMAPELTWEGSRIKKDWLLAYLKVPYAIRPLLTERMPRFKFTDAEREAVYEYFYTTLLDDRVEDLAAETAALPLDRLEILQAGENLFYAYGCDACHPINLKGGSIAPDLTNSGERLRTDFVDFYLRNPKAFVPRSLEPVYHFSKTEITALTAFIVGPKEKK
jgi:cbb3-type cytochrome oxidase cytochrome c subunit